MVCSEEMNKYCEAIHQEMLRLYKIPNTIFLGQQVAVTNFYGLLTGIPKEKRLEYPVAEEMQLGMSIGMALEGYLPISIYQRFDFLPRAMDALVNHLNIIKELSHKIFNPKIIIFTTVGSSNPLDVGPQHKKDLTWGFKILLNNINVMNPKTDKEVKKSFKIAHISTNSSLIIIYQDLIKE